MMMMMIQFDEDKDDEAPGRGRAHPWRGARGVTGLAGRRDESGGRGVAVNASVPAPGYISAPSSSSPLLALPFNSYSSVDPKQQ